MNFKEHEELIKNSIEGVDRSCPACHSNNTRSWMQSLAYNKEYVRFEDIYNYTCLECGNEFLVVSKPFRM